MPETRPSPLSSLPPLDVPALLKQHGLRPNPRLGQNFLIDPVALLRVVNAAGIEPDETVLEIGPGLGSLTRYLAVLARQVIAVELDRNLIPPLEHVLSPYPNVRLMPGDILGLDLEQLFAGLLNPPASAAENMSPAYLVVANIPYYITSALIRRLLEARVQPTRMILTVQREVAERIVADPGDMSLLALSVQVYGQPRIQARIPAGAFYPAPKVDSAVVRVDLLPFPRIAPALLDTFFRLAKAGFSQKRKNLRNSLSGGMRWSTTQAESYLEPAGIDPKRRAETLSLEEWNALVQIVASSPDRHEDSSQ